MASQEYAPFRLSLEEYQTITSQTKEILNIDFDKIQIIQFGEGQSSILKLFPFWLSQRILR